MLEDVRKATLQYANLGGGEVPLDAASAELATALDAVVVCGYGEMGQLACDVLADAERGGGAVGADELRDQVALPSGAWGTQFIAIDRNPSRVSIGLAKQVRVVYGDGASPELLRAAGVSKPRAILVTYANDKRCLETTSRLRESFPEAPIFVRARTAADAESLMHAGATEVVVEAVESVVRFASLVGAGADATDSLLRASPAFPDRVLQQVASGVSLQRDSVPRGPPYPEEELEALAAECGITRTQISDLYDGFALLSANDDGEVELSAIRNLLSSVGVLPAAEEETLTAWMAEADRDGSNALSFFEYVRVDTRASQQRMSAAPVEGSPA